MKKENHLHHPRPLLNRTPAGVLMAIALAAGMACLGFFAGKKNTAPPQLADSGLAKFVLLVHNDDTPAANPMQQVQEYGAWLKSIRGERFADGEHLHSDGWILSKNGVENRTTFPGRNEIGGYFLFEAADADEALKVARSCPHLDYEGTLELRQIHQ